MYKLPTWILYALIRLGIAAGFAAADLGIAYVIPNGVTPAVLRALACGVAVTIAALMCARVRPRTPTR